MNKCIAVTRMKFKMADDKLIFTTVLFAYILNHTT